jgi:hypothetical protein
LSTCVLAGTGSAQTPLQDAKFAVEIPGPKGFPPSYHPVGSNGGSSLFYDESLHRVAGGDPSRRQPTALKLEYKVDGDLVLITASVFFGDFDRQTTPVSLYNLPQQRLGTYSAGLNQSVTLSEMEQFGLEPLTLKIAAAQPPASFHPRTMSKAPSIQMEIVGEDRTFYKVALHNLSTRAVTAVRVDMPEENGAQGGQTTGDGSQDLMAPGATYQFQFGIPHSGRMSNGGFVEGPPPPLLVLETALFKDGGYEGDMQAAAEIAAQRIGSEIQRQRIDHLVAAILADAQSDDDAKVARIRSEVAQLTEDPDPPMVESVQAQFPGLSGQVAQRLKTWLGIGLNTEKQKVTFGLKEFERSKAGPRRGFTLARWWSTWRDAKDAMPY